jgi:hypothetical protein
MLDRDATLAAVDLRDLADDLLGIPGGTQRSPTWPCPDPEHGEPAYAPGEVTLYLTRRGEQRWHCHGCGTGGTAIDLVMKCRGMGVRQALAFLSARASAHPQATPTAPVAGPRSAGADPPAARSGLDAWVAQSAALLWQPYGDPVRQWLTEVRRIPEDVLRTNRVGATGITPDRVLPTRRAVPVQRSASRAALLPIISKDRAIHVQLRLIAPGPDEPRYLNPPPEGGRHPRLGLYRPAQRRHPEILVTEGIIDALSANTAGFRAAAILSPGLADAEVAVHLSRLHGPLVMALDPDGPGDEAADRLMHHLAARGRRPVWLPVLNGDLNDSLVQAHDWPRKLAAHVRQATASNPPDRVPTL